MTTSSSSRSARAASPKYLTLRNVPAEVASALAKESRRRDQSQNEVAIGLLRDALGLRGDYSNGLEKLAGTWTAKHLSDFEEAVRCTEAVDDEDWK